MFKKGSIILVLVFAALASAMAQESVSYTNSIALTPTAWDLPTDIQQFNPSLGVLQSMDVSITSHLSSVLTVTNLSSDDSSGDANTEIWVILGDGSLFSTTNNSSLAYSGNPVLDYYSDSFNFTNLGTGYEITASEIGTGVVDSGMITDSGILAEFTGSGAVDEDVETVAFAGVNYTGGNASADQVTSADYTSIVTYNYLVPVPEPSGGWLLSGGLAVCGHFNRRRIL